MSQIFRCRLAVTHAGRKLTEDPTVRFFLTNVPVEDGERRIQSTDLFGMQIEEAIILRAKRPESVGPRRKVAHSALSGSSHPGSHKQRTLEQV